MTKAGGVLAAVLAAAVLWAMPGTAGAEPGTTVQIAAGGQHNCALLTGGSVHCWGSQAEGQLGYGGLDEEGNGELKTIGDDELPSAAGPVDFGGHSVTAISAGGNFTCAILDDGTVRCWGDGTDGHLGYGNTDMIGHVHPPGFYGPVDLGPGRTAAAIASGGAHSCAILDNGQMRCWGQGGFGELGYGILVEAGVGDNETPGSMEALDLGPGRTATAITAGDYFTCAILDNGAVLCWGRNSFGQLGYGNTQPVGDNETPGSVGPVNLGPGRTATAISSGSFHTCAILDNGQVRCWGESGSGALGYGDTATIGDNETPDTAGPVNLGVGRTATAISTGAFHTCAVLDNGQVRCWGSGAHGALGYGNTNPIGDTETPDTAGPVEFGGGRTAVSLSAKGEHTCAVLDDSTVRCWGSGESGNLGYASTEDVGDNEQLSAAGPIDLVPPPPPPSVPLEPREPPAPLPLATTTVPPPVAGKTVNAEPAAGTVTVRCPGDRGFGPLTATEQIPLGCVIDTRHGTVSLTSARAGGGTQTGLFWAGVFEVSQGGGKRAEVILTLTGPLECGRSRVAARGGGPGRKLWGSGQGNFKTVGKHGSAGVRGTIWLVADRCDDSTLFQVKKGVVTVRDFEKDATVTLRKGKSYVAR